MLGSLWPIFLAWAMSSSFLKDLSRAVVSFVVCSTVFWEPVLRVGETPAASVGENLWLAVVVVFMGPADDGEAPAVAAASEEVGDLWSSV